MIKPVIIEALPPSVCEICQCVDELRPYGPKGEWVCFDCGMKDEEAANRGFEERFKPGGMRRLRRNNS